MNIPLYKSAQAPSSRDEKGNSGLWFDRFFNQYDHNWQVGDTSKKSFLEQISGNENKGLCGDEAQLSKYVARQSKLINSQGGLSGVFKSDWRWVTGMGNNHPVENGMQWHTVLGVPYLPGSAVKGLVRAWMEQQEQPDFDKIHQWFGSDNKDPEKQTKTTQAGQIIFHDATPYQKVDVVLDVMTPHTGSWLTEGGVINAPADWHDPIPVVFLSCKRIKLFFSIAKMTHADETIDLKDVWNELVCALDFLGSGAKTSTGYGFMSEDSKINSDLKYEQELENKASEREKLSNEELKVQELIDLYKKDQEFNVSKGKGNTGALVGHLRDLLKEAVSWEEKDKIEIHTLAKDIYKYLNVDVKKKGKVKDLLKSLGV